MIIEINETEKKTLLFYLNKAKIDSEGMYAIGIGDRSTVNNINSFIKKVRITK